MILLIMPSCFIHSFISFLKQTAIFWSKCIFLIIRYISHGERIVVVKRRMYGIEKGNEMKQEQK